MTWCLPGYFLLFIFVDLAVVEGLLAIIFSECLVSKAVVVVVRIETSCELWEKQVLLVLGSEEQKGLSPAIGATLLSSSSMW